MLHRLLRFFLEQKVVTTVVVLAVVLQGLAVAPFSWDLGGIPRDPVPVDAIPDLGDNQQIVFTEWPGRSPQDVEDQITYPLTVALLGVPGVRTVRSSSIFGLSTIYVLFEEDVEFYWSRSRILEKLSSLPGRTLPEGVQPALGPDATALGQVFWYTLEGRDPTTGEARGGWDPQELRTIQDFYVGYALAAASGVAEVAPIGGFVKEYQVDIDPVAMTASGVTVAQIMAAVRKSNLDVGARTIEFNRAEYLVRGLGYLRSLDDLREAVVAVRENTPIRIGDVAVVAFGPETRRGGLDKGGVEATGAVVVARYGANPMEVIRNIREVIEEISPGLPSKTLDDGTVSKVTIVPFYDRSGLIRETLGTLESALGHEILISVLVVLILVRNLRASVLISSLLPLGVLLTFGAMRVAGVDANIVSLSGIAIAIGVMVDVGIVLSENIVRHLEAAGAPAPRGRALLETIHRATSEVAGAVVTALATTVISFLPVFAMEAAEGKLFRPLAFTKTFALLAALFVGLVVLPTFAWLLFSLRVDRPRVRTAGAAVLLAIGIVALATTDSRMAWFLVAIGLNGLLAPLWPERRARVPGRIDLALCALAVVLLLTVGWMPLGASHGALANGLFVLLTVLVVVGSLAAVVRYYRPLLRACLAHKAAFLLLPGGLVVLGFTVWLGTERTLGPVADAVGTVGLDVRASRPWQALARTFPGVGKEFMPALDEGSFLLMPSTMSHSGIEENLEVVRLLDQAVAAIPEVESVVGKWGRVKSALDPAPISMFENLVNYRSEYVLDEDGRRRRFAVDDEGAFLLRDGSTHRPGEDPFRVVEPRELVPDEGGLPFRQWRPEIASPDDIWDEVVRAARIPGMTSAPKLQPIQTRLIMLSTGMRAPLGIKVYGPDLPTIERFGLELERRLRDVPSVEPGSVFADRIVGKPYLELRLDRRAIARYGLTIEDVQRTIEVAVGGVRLTTTVEGRERYPVRVRYAREMRDSPSAIGGIYVPTPSGQQIPLRELAEITYRRGPQLIKSEDTFLVGYVIFDKRTGRAEVDVAEDVQASLRAAIATGDLAVPAGVRFELTGNVENQVRASKKLAVVVPLCLLAIFLILHLQFRDVATAAMVFTGVAVAFSGGFLLIWLYGQGWFLDVGVGRVNLRDLFQIGPVHLSVAVWVGFIALFGIATDDGVLMATYLQQVFSRHRPESVEEIRAAVLEAGLQRVRPATTTSATTVIALLPVLTSQGRGADIMIPMAIPTVGGMVIQTLTMFVVPVLYCAWKERELRRAPQEDPA